MTETSTWVTLGAVAALPLIVYARARRMRAPADRAARAASAPLAWGLFVAALIYVGFAARALPTPWLGVEIVGVVLFGALAAAGHRWSPWLLALGWVLHVGWDVFLHAPGETPFVPAAYPMLCVGFDLVVAGYLAWLSATAAPSSRPAGSGSPPARSTR